MKLLTICPSIRPNLLEKMLISYYNTVSEPSIIINTEVKSITEIINEAFQKNPDYDFYHICNDDVIYKTPRWDVKLCNKGKISYGNDIFQSENLCTFPCIDGNIVRATGWLQMPTLERYYGDSCWHFMGRQLDIMNYVPDVVIEHQWKGADVKMYEEDTSKFAEWLPYSFKDINKIKDLLNGKNL